MTMLLAAIEKSKSLGHDPHLPWDMQSSESVIVTHCRKCHRHMMRIKGTSVGVQGIIFRKECPGGTKDK
jgi:hypothetical protein